MTSPTAPATDDAEWLRMLASYADEVEAPRLEAIANRLSQEAVLRDALEQIAVYGCGMLNQPAELNGPEASWLRRRIEAYEQTARTALTGKQSANLGHSISTGNRTPV